MTSSLARAPCAAPIQGVARDLGIRLGIDALVVTRAEEDDKLVVGMHDTTGEVGEDAAVVATHAVPRATLGGNIGTDAHALTVQDPPGNGRPRFGAQAAFLGAGGIRITDHRDMVQPRSGVGEPVRPHRRRPLCGHAKEKRKCDDERGQTDHCYLHCPQHFTGTKPGCGTALFV